MIYHNYHKHDHKGNIRALDVVVKLRDYCERAVELGHTTIFTTNHGMQGDIFEATVLAQEYGLKLIVGAECYYVKNRFEKDRSNRHLVVIALNDEGVRQLNEMISISNVDGYYYKPRIDYVLLMGLNPKNFVITTACVAGILKDEELVLKLYDKFKSNFFVEVQNHNVDTQKYWNKLALEYNRKYGIGLIHANDSHYIYKEDKKYRDLFLKAKDMIYSDEGEFILDYPSYEEIVERYKKQGVLTNAQISEALENTHVFDKAEPITIINKDIKLPSMSKNPNYDLKKIIFDVWQIEKKNIAPERIKEYEEAIRYEMDIIERTHMEDYFLLDYKVVERGIKEYGGMLTKTGRGSAPSFYTTKLLGLTDIDRLESPITLFPTRFMSAERILLARSLPDIDLNMVDREPFIRATEDLLGKENCAWMISWKPLQKSSAFRLWCKANGMNINEYNEVAKDIDNYIDNPQWKDIIKESEHFVGVVESISESPCSLLIYKDIAREVGLVKSGDKICCLLDGYHCDVFKYLKNDYLSVTVWKLIKEVCDLANIEVPSIKEFNNLLDDKTFEIYEKGLTSTINQADSDWATPIIKKYAPKSLAEMSAFVAGIRPGFASLLDNFINRKPYSTNVEELDNLLEDSYHYLLYQESIMKYLIWLGIEEKETYDIIKKISKKKFKEKELQELKNKLKKGWSNVVGKEEGFEETWKVVEDASRYSFNASHSLSYAYDSLYGAYLKAHYPIEYYTVVLNEYSDDERKTKVLSNELNHFGIKLRKPQFRYSKSVYVMDKETNSIYKGIKSYKYLNEIVGEELYELRNNKYNNFIELLYDLKNTSINSRQMNVLIKLDFFREFGKTKYLLEVYNVFDSLYGKKQFSINKLPCGLTAEEISKYSNKATEKQFKEIDIKGLMNYCASKIKNEDLSIEEIFKTMKEYQGYIDYVDKTWDVQVYVVTEIKTTKYSIFAELYNLNQGEITSIKVDKKRFNYAPLNEYDTIYAVTEVREKKQKVEGKWVGTGEYQEILTNWRVVV
jgi:DNA polymerase III alpha subunit